MFCRLIILLHQKGESVFVLLKKKCFFLIHVRVAVVVYFNFDKEELFSVCYIIRCSTVVLLKNSLNL